MQSIEFFKRHFSAFHGVDDVFFDFGNIFFGKLPFKNVYLCVTHGGAFLLGHQLNALRRTVCTHIKLPGKERNGKNECTFACFELVKHNVCGRLGEDGGNGAIKIRFFDVFHIVAVDESQACQPFDT